MQSKLALILALCITAFISRASGATLPTEQVDEIAIEKRQTSTRAPNPGCTHGPTTRACWKNGYSIATDFDEKFPMTSNTVRYNFELTNGTCNPDGHGERICLLINGQYPGPTIRAKWGDNLEITVKNSMQDNGTSMHFHGVRQYHSSGDDGVNGLTECPLAPGDTKIYRFQVSQFGTCWYHSHYSAQYGDGIIGPIVFEGPAAANYDIDLGPYMLNEYQQLQKNSPPPSADNILINGTNKNADGGGRYNQVTITKGKKYLLRLINQSVDNWIRVSLDNHVMQVISADFIPIRPFYAETLLLSIGQRYDVVINANQTAGNYWFRADNAYECFTSNKFYGRAIWTYSGVKVKDPITSPYASPGNCVEPTPQPYWVQPVPNDNFTNTVQDLDVTLTRQVIVPGRNPIVVWALGDPSLNVQFEKPTFSYLFEGNGTFPPEYRVLTTESQGGWNYWVIQQSQRAPPIPHPIHLHGHDFFVLGQGKGTLDVSTANLNFATATRRDTTDVPGQGWLALAFRSNNPGVWLMHCHIAWHASEGLAVQFLESPNYITMPDRDEYAKTCRNWKKYAPTAAWHKDDSGV